MNQYERPIESNMNVVRIPKCQSTTQLETIVSSRPIFHRKIIQQLPPEPLQQPVYYTSRIPQTPQIKYTS